MLKNEKRSLVLLSNKLVIRCISFYHFIASAFFQFVAQHMCDVPNKDEMKKRVKNRSSRNSTLFKLKSEE